MTESSFAANPYIAGNPVTGDQMFFGREDVFEFIRQALIGRHQNNVIVLYGQRRTGKTSVLYQVRRHLGPEYLHVLIDLQAFSLDGIATFLWEIAGITCRTLRREYDIRVEQPQRQEFATDPRGFFEGVFLSRVWSAIGHRHLVLMFDETARLEDQVQDGKLERDVFDYLRHLMQHNQQLDFIFSIGSRLEEMQREYAVLFNVALYKQITTLAPEAARALITQPVRGTFDYEDDAVAQLLKISGGHAYYTQLLCHSVYTRWEHTGSSPVTVEDVQAVLPEVVERGAANLKFVWDQAGPVERLVITGMAELMGDENLPVATSRVHELLSEKQLELSSQEINKAHGDLVSREVIVGTEEFRFATDLLRLYLRQHHRIDWVREDLGAAIQQTRQVQVAKARGPSRSRLIVAMSVATVAVILGILVGALLVPPSLPSLFRSSTPPDAGLYEFNRCSLPRVGGEERLRLKLCVESVDVQPNGDMRFNISWTTEIEEGLVVDGIRVTGLLKSSDVDNPNMYVTDDQGNRYAFMDLGGAAKDEILIPDGERADGWFLFPTPQGKARLFTFHDDDNFWAIPGISLETP